MSASHDQGRGGRAGGDLTAALPAEVSWEAPAPGAYTRSLRFGEWIAAPVTPLFESWLLSTLEERLHAWIRSEIGQRAPLPHHVVVNGWYFYSLNWISPGNMLRSLPAIIGHVVRHPRRVAGVLPSLAHHSVPLLEREWREDLQPRYRAAVAAAASAVETVPSRDLPALIDDLAELAGEYFGSLVALAGAAYKLEINLARFHRRHVAPLVGEGHLPLLAGLMVPPRLSRHAVLSLDWFDAAAPDRGAPVGASGEGHARAIRAREVAEAAARAALAGSPKRLRAFERLLTDAQHIIPIREEQVAELTLPWPVLRRAVLRIGEALVEKNRIEAAEDVFFLTRDEALAGLADGHDGSLRRSRRVACGAPSRPSSCPPCSSVTSQGHCDPSGRVTRASSAPWRRPRRSSPGCRHPPAGSRARSASSAARTTSTSFWQERFSSRRSPPRPGRRCSPVRRRW